MTAGESTSRFSALGPRDAGAMLDPPGAAGVGIVQRLGWSCAVKAARGWVMARSCPDRDRAPA
jgi:hypothetical protein